MQSFVVSGMRATRQSPEYAHLLQCPASELAHCIAHAAGGEQMMRAMYQMLSLVCSSAATTGELQRVNALALIDALESRSGRLLPLEALPDEQAHLVEPRVWAVCSAALFNNADLMRWLADVRPCSAAVLDVWLGNMLRHPELCPHMNSDTAALLAKLCGQPRRGTRSVRAPPPFRYCVHCNAYTCDCAPPPPPVL